MKNPLKNLRAGSLLILIPIVTAVVTLYYVAGAGLITAFANRGNNRLVTNGWQQAKNSLESEKPSYGPKFSYYKLDVNQNLAWASQHFGVNLSELQKLNPGNAATGTTIIVPPVEKPMEPFSPNQASTAGVVVVQKQGMVYVSNRFTNQKANITIPQLMELTQPYGAISQIGPKKFLINKALYVQNNIRVDIASDTVSDLLMRSQPDFNITALTFENSEALIKGVNISTYDPTTKKPDSDIKDGRGFLRVYKNGRMDVIDSTASYLGMGDVHNPVIRARAPVVDQGGVYGVAWRISNGTFGYNIATGWVQDSTFEHNYIGAYTFGASGMMWQHNLFTANEVYGLDPHDDSNNATIEYNRFVANGKHGFIVSKRCDYNLIRDNISVGNSLHGFMLHANSDYNILENNLSIGNHDNFVVYGSSFNSISGNKGYDALGSQVRINKSSVENYITDNLFYGGKKGVYLYDGVNGAEVANNTFYDVDNQLVARGAQRVFYGGNRSNQVGYEINSGDRVVFGVNTVDRKEVDLRPLEVIRNGQAQHQGLTKLSEQALRLQLR